MNYNVAGYRRRHAYELAGLAFTDPVAAIQLQRHAFEAPKQAKQADQQVPPLEAWGARNCNSTSISAGRPQQCWHAR
jgi:hypothetical protein